MYESEGEGRRPCYRYAAPFTDILLVGDDAASGLFLTARLPRPSSWQQAEVAAAFESAQRELSRRCQLPAAR